MVIVKPGFPYHDICRRVKERFEAPNLVALPGLRAEIRDDGVPPPPMAG